MIVYRKTEEEMAAAELLDGIERLSEQVRLYRRHEDAVELLIEIGTFETGVLDSLFPEKDGINEMSAQIRLSLLLAGHIFRASWERKSEEVSSCAERLIRGLRDIRKMPLPVKIKTRIPEGYAHYGLFPEVYLKAAIDFFEDVRPAEAVCIGLRSIGASLSAIVSAALESKGTAVRSFTIRPKGHPFRRKAVFDSTLEQTIRGMKDSYFLVVDEGPGMSGSSFASACSKLSSLGIKDDRIILFPSWVPDGGAFISKEARQRWARHLKYAAYFEDVWLNSGRLESEIPLKGPVRDISAGMWRGLFFDREKDFPTTHPHHEKRKYIAGEPPSELMLKFAGHGRFGRVKMKRAMLLSEAGFIPPPIGLSHGFLLTEFVPGRPVSERDVNQILLDEMARYMAFIAKNFRSDERMDFSEVLEMIIRNISLGLGPDWAEKAVCLEEFQKIYDSGLSARVDGRMMPHEWILTGKGYVKSDCLDHHADQFFTGTQDIAWDLGSAIIEFDLNPMEQGYLLSKYSSLAADEVGRERLKLNMVAYLAFRLGYTSFAAEELAGTVEGQGFRSMNHRYATRLKKELLWLID